MPERNVPARPFMYPGMENAIPAVTDKMQQMATAVELRMVALKGQTMETLEES